MILSRSILGLSLAAATLYAHPMGNFSVSHYSRIEVQPRGLAIRYVLDLAEIPTFELLQQWKADATTPQADLDRMASAQAREWGRNLRAVVDGRPVAAALDHTTIALDKGAGGMPIARVTAEFGVETRPGKLAYEDENYPERAGWKEIVIVKGDGAELRNASPAGSDRSR